MKHQDTFPFTLNFFIWPVNPYESTFFFPFSDFSISSLFTLIPISKKIISTQIHIWESDKKKPPDIYRYIALVAAMQPIVDNQDL